MTESSEQPRSILRSSIGILLIGLGAGAMISIYSLRTYYGFGFLGFYYGAMMIALGLTLILPKKRVEQ